MTAPIRILDTGLMPARWNVAMTAALAELHAKGRMPDTVRFHRYPRCVLLGRSQRAQSAADLDYCRRHDIEIARRVTGGGAVYMSRRMLAWDVVLDRRDFGGSLEVATRWICEGVAAGLSRLGVAARFRAPGDIEIGGRKVSGSSGCAGRRSVILQGTVLTGDDAAAMACALRIPETALRDRVTSLGEALGRVPSAASIVASITRGIAEVMHREPAQASPSAEEAALCDALLHAQIGGDGFVYGDAEGAAA
jgi:lipoate-protein ligase A